MSNTKMLLGKNKYLGTDCTHGHTPINVQNVVKRWTEAPGGV